MNVTEHVFAGHARFAGQVSALHFALDGALRAFLSVQTMCAMVTKSAVLIALLALAQFVSATIPVWFDNTGSRST